MSNPADRLTAIDRLRDALTCNRFGGGHYCPNCDNGIEPSLADEVATELRTLQQQLEEQTKRADLAEAAWRRGMGQPIPCVLSAAREPEQAYTEPSDS